MEVPEVEVLRASGPKVIALPAHGFAVFVPREVQTARQLFAEHPEIVAAVDGPMFDYATGEPRSYATYRRGRVSYALGDTSTGANVAPVPGNERRGITLSLVDGRLVGSVGGTPALGADAWAQLYPSLVVNGAVTQGLTDSDRTWRVAVGILRDGRLGFAEGAMSMQAFADALASAGFVWAGYTDGGGSASLVTRDESGALRGSDPDDPDGRRVPSWIAWRRPESGILDTAAKSLGLAMIPPAALASGFAAIVLLVILLVVLLRRKRA